uniref:Uncharacterized protein n=1 Tax=Arundo donax TaxID=35708 RepID=A0A0A9DV06_ARUDO
MCGDVGEIGEREATAERRSTLPPWLFWVEAAPPPTRAPSGPETSPNQAVDAAAPLTSSAAEPFLSRTVAAAFRSFAAVAFRSRTATASSSSRVTAASR